MGLSGSRFWITSTSKVCFNSTNIFVYNIIFYVAAAFGSFSQQRLKLKLLILVFINIIVKSQRLRALPRTSRQRYAHAHAR